ncbi:hypothetical protein GGH99_001043 [Coemansia sp. RSA 1285]|nr:hypothetical protein GGH99_001043 [Coemansia sp. RSA 1285]
MAVGNAMGEVSLQLYPSGGPSGDADVGFTPTGVNVYNESERACSQLAFNPIHTDLLACGFDYGEGMPSLHIYDITRSTDVRQLLGTRSTPWSVYSENADIQQQTVPLATVDAVDTNTTIGNPVTSRPSSARSSNIAVNERDGEYGPMHSSSGVTSLSWVPNSVDDILVASKKNRSSIRWYDLRMRYAGETVLYVPMPNANGSGYPTPGTVYDLQFDPFNSYRYMAHDRQGLVNMWDIRCASRALYSFTLGKDTSIVQVAYSPRRSGTIAALAANSNILDIYSISEFTNGQILEADALNTTMFLEDARMKDHYDEYRSAAVSDGEPRNVHAWMDHTHAAMPSENGIEPSSTFLWVPPTISCKTLSHQQIITCSDTGVLSSSALPMKLVADFSSRGDVAISNNWTKLFGSNPRTDIEMEELHIQTPEFRELILDKHGRQSTASSTNMSNTATNGGVVSVATATPGILDASVGLNTHASAFNMASTGTTIQPQQQQGSNNGLLARRQQAAIHQAASSSDANVAQLGERIKAMSLGLSAGNNANNSNIRNSTSPPMNGYVEDTKVQFNPILDGRAEGDEHVEGVLGGDILSQMRRRVVRGYGSSAEKNTYIVGHEQKTRDMWQWVRDGEIRRHSGEYHISAGIDASFYGTYTIMNLSRKHMRYLEKQSQQALLELQQGYQRQQRQKKTCPAPAIQPKSKLNAQRRLALLYCGWGLEGSIRGQHIYALEAVKKFSIAAGVAFIYGDQQRCLQSLERSNSQDQKLLSFMLKAQLNANNNLAGGDANDKSSVPKDMFFCPYLQMIFTYLVTGDWDQVIQSMSGLPLSYRLALALRYMSDEALMRFIVAAGRTAVSNGDIDGIIITGITGNGRHVLGRFVDNTADVQTAALVSMFDPEQDPGQSEQYEGWIYAYRCLLNRWRMFTTRSLFDIALGNNREAKGIPRLSKAVEALTTKAADTRCTFCHQALGYDVNKLRSTHVVSNAMYVDGLGDDGLGAGIASVGLGQMAGGTGGSPGQTSTKIIAADGRALYSSKTTQSVIGQHGVSATGNAAMGVEPWRKDAHSAQTRLLYTHCPRCSNRLPRCIICRMTLGTPAVQPSNPEDVTAGAGAAAADSEFSQWFSWCQTCGHGGHVSHLEDWFATHKKCPIPGCECECDKKC